MRALVGAALNQLSDMGVQIRRGEEWAWPQVVDEMHHRPTFWAAGIKSLVDALGLDWPAGMTPPRPLTVVNVLLPDENPPHDLHYAFDYSERPLFRQTWYRNFAPKGWNLMGLELLEPGDDIEFVRSSNPGSTVLGVHKLGPTLPVPTKRNEMLLEQLRTQLGAVRPNVQLVGAGAKAGLFFQGEVLKHVAEVCT
jgi:hypothetical protein